MNIEMLDTSGFVTLPSSVTLRHASGEAMKSWQRFCRLPSEKKRLLSSGDRINDFGYMKRDDKFPNADDKELFHAVRCKQEVLLQKADAIDDRRAVEFIAATNTFIALMQPYVHKFAEDVESRYKLWGFAQQVMDSWDYCTFRFLRYPKNQPILANPHADRDGFTFHLNETEGGGEYYDLQDRIWRSWPVSETQTIIFPSMGLQFRSASRLNALWHRVVPVESPSTERFAMVAFIDFQFSHKFDDSRFRMQDFKPGFNYDMPFDEFAKFFIPRKELVPG